jgi:hypothetical protein
MIYPYLLDYAENKYKMEKERQIKLQPKQEHKIRS